MGPIFWTNLIHPSSFPPTRTGHSREWRPQTGGQCLASLEGFSRRQHSPGFLKDPTLVAEENKKPLVIFLVCLSVYLYLCIAYILIVDSVLDVRVGGAERERYCRCGWYLSVAPSPGGTRVTQSTLCWGYTVRWWWKQGEGGRPWPQTSETPDLLQLSDTSHGKPPGRVMVPTSLCMWVGFSLSPGRTH